jgi:exonuclease VII small subunit
LLRLLFLARLQKQKRNKKTRKVKSNQMIKLELLNNADFKNLIKVVDKLEQRIATLEKVLASHAKCIGEMRKDNE